MNVSIQQSKLEGFMAYYRKELERPRYDLYRKIQAKEKKPIASVASSKACSALEQFLGAYRAVKEVLMQEGIPSEVFQHAYAVYLAVLYVTHALQIPASAKPIPMQINFQQTQYALLDSLLLFFVQQLPEKGMEDFVAAYFSGLREATGNVLQSPNHQQVRERIAQCKIQLDGIAFHGFTLLNRKEEQPVSYQDLSLDDVVGNHEAKKALRESLEHVLSYKAAERKNAVQEIFGFPQKFLLEGREGTGKTTLLKALACYGRKVAEQHGLDFRVLHIDNSFKNEYYGVSARNLKQQLQEVFSGDAIYLVTMEDIDTIFFSREELKHQTEDKAVLGELLNLLEGIASSNLGNYILVATTNNPLSQDRAVYSRLLEQPLHASGPETEEDYIALFQQKLKLDTKISPADWQEVGTECTKNHFSGRDIRNIALQILSGAMQEREKPKEWYTLSVEQQRAWLLEGKQGITKESVLEHIESYDSFLRKKEGGEKGYAKTKNP
ncbi:AAA family ATPase [Candidatus Woesearchaeota archaeon]|nr:AAA family ATPase [Candidatus Woesearchaeota archaeon]